MWNSQARQERNVMGYYDKVYTKLYSRAIHISKVQQCHSCEMDNKSDIFALSTFHGNACNDDLPHKPEMIETYSQFINGVGRADQSLTYYSLNKKSRK